MASVVTVVKDVDVSVVSKEELEELLEKFLKKPHIIHAWVEEGKLWVKVEVAED